MNCGLTNLETLKKQLLAGSLMNDVKFDAALQVIGLGVAGLFEKYCNRKFLRTVGDTCQFEACRDHYYVPRYPLEAVSKVEERDDSDVGWEELTGEVLNLNEESGLVRFAGIMGSELAMIRLTYTGGYWWETLDPSEEGYPSTMPAGATALPDALRAAFLTQCEQAWQTHDKLGTGVIGAGAGAQFLNTKLSTLELVPIVKTVLQQFVRYQLS